MWFLCERYKTRNSFALQGVREYDKVSDEVEQKTETQVNGKGVIGWVSIKDNIQPTVTFESLVHSFCWNLL